MKDRFAKLLRWTGVIWIALSFLFVRDLGNQYGYLSMFFWGMWIVFSIPGIAAMAIAWVMDGKKV